jgi:predicted nucleotidyltransferase
MSVDAISKQPFAIEFDRGAIVQFCRKWGIRQLSVFGSVLHAEEFRSDSDVDVLVEFGESAHDWGPWGSRWEEMSSELAALFGRKVDIVERRRLENPFIRHSILTTHRVVYAA